MAPLNQQQIVGALIAIARAARAVVESDRATGAALTEVSVDNLTNLETHLAVLDNMAGEGDQIDLAAAWLSTVAQPERKSYLAVGVKRVEKHAILPAYATDGSGCFDLFACQDLVIGHGHPATVDTGLAFEIPEGHVMLIFSRSGHGFKSDTRLANCVGVIDSDYRATVKVRLTMDAPRHQLDLPYGRAIAQAIILPFQRVAFLETDELSETARGTGGFGSTDKQ